MSREFPGIERTPTGMSFRSGEPPQFPYSIFSSRAWATVNQHGFRLNSRGHSWSECTRIVVDGGPDVPERIVVDTEPRPIVLFRGEAGPGHKWTLAEIRAFALELAKLADLPLHDHLGRLDVWLEDSLESFDAFLAESTPHAPNASTLVPPKMFIKPGFTQLIYRQRKGGQTYRVRVQAGKVIAPRMEVELAGIRKTGISWKEDRMATAYTTIKVGSVPVRVPTAYADGHMGSLWALVGVRRVLLLRLFCGAATTPGQLRWLTVELMKHAAKADARGTADAIPDDLKHLTKR